MISKRELKRENYVAEFSDCLIGLGGKRFGCDNGLKDQPFAVNCSWRGSAAIATEGKLYSTERLTVKAFLGLKRTFLKFVFQHSKHKNEQSSVFSTAEISALTGVVAAGSFGLT